MLLRLASLTLRVVTHALGLGFILAADGLEYVERLVELDVQAGR